MASHAPVMVAEVLDVLAPARGGFFVDCTVGPGGHARAILDAGATRVLGIDRDPEALSLAREALRTWLDRVELVHADFRDLAAVLDARDIDRVDGILADLGVSSLQLDSAQRGFSFRVEAPLDMRMDATTGESAADWLSQASEQEIADVVYRFGEDRFARRIARAIVRARERGPVRTTTSLADVVRRAVPRKGYQRIDPATRTFQAIRIRVNRELDRLDTFVRDAIARLRAGARLAVISFHSLEDRIVKHAFRSAAQGGDSAVHLLTRRPLTPTDEEVARNPRARSARLRALERLA
jgi:16S rRNA (cytosine1402-N4)-methyltransferase